MNTASARIDCEKDTITIGLEDVSHEFNFAKFHRQPHDKEFPSKDEIIGLASIVMPPHYKKRHIRDILGRTKKILSYL